MKATIEVEAAMMKAAEVEAAVKIAQVDHGSSDSSDDEPARTDRTTTMRVHNSCAVGCYVPEALRAHLATKAK